ncbi:hypothetical protein A3I27_00475 [Candidatus Giovannonibacteria bacterium RIFCSPLOWO2_02_FULL_43_11b]|nr:MAG: hypothetical protein A2739_01720 [Candidatus Giovannonibacteria bacterium RIFCSPHIGHO2_01_FULL_43_100]OGF89466.1 MAG: hypothetical protein A3I27_00475 [Candidatus Giovannonibacteria bacterium RIFCSPLOWO2_02_FULL_43_11b]
MSDKALMTRAELELTQKMQREFPAGGVVHPDIIKEVNDSPELTAHLTAFLQNRGRMQVGSTSGIVAPQNGIVLPFTIPVNESRDWNDVVRAVGLNTDHSNDIWKVGDQFAPTAGMVERLEQIYLVNFGKDSITQSLDALAWGKEQHIIPVSPRADFAIAEHFPKLHTYLGMDPMAIVSLQRCSFESHARVAKVWFNGSERSAILGWFENDWNDDYWFPFVREFEAGNSGS